MVQLAPSALMTRFPHRAGARKVAYDMMNTPRNTPTGPGPRATTQAVRRIAASGLCKIGVIALLAASPALAQTTQAERVSLGEEEPSIERLQRFQADCSAWLRAGTETEVDGVIGMVTFFTEMRILQLGGVVGETDQDAYPVLPHGGIGGTDFCDRVLVQLPEGETLTLNGTAYAQVSGVRLRPGLDLAADYPAADAILVENDQVRDLGEGSYFALPSTSDAPTSQAFADLIDFSRPVLVTPQGTFFPLRE